MTEYHDHVVDTQATPINSHQEQRRLLDRDYRYCVPNLDGPRIYWCNKCRQAFMDQLPVTNIPEEFFEGLSEKFPVDGVLWRGWGLNEDLGELAKYGGPKEAWDRVSFMVLGFPNRPIDEVQRTAVDLSQRFKSLVSYDGTLTRIGKRAYFVMGRIGSGIDYAYNMLSRVLMAGGNSLLTYDTTGRWGIPIDKGSTWYSRKPVIISAPNSAPAVVTHASEYSGHEVYLPLQGKGRELLFTRYIDLSNMATTRSSRHAASLPHEGDVIKFHFGHVGELEDASDFPEWSLIYGGPIKMSISEWIAKYGPAIDSVPPNDQPSIRTNLSQLRSIYS